MRLIHLSTMRVTPLILSFIYIYSCIRVLDHSLCDATSLQRFSDGKLNFAYFTEHHYHALDVPKVEGMILPSRNHCLKKCLKNPQCFSANVAAFHRPDGNLSCDLLPIDKYIAQGTFRRNHSFHHYSIKVSISRAPIGHPQHCTQLFVPWRRGKGKGDLAVHTWPTRSHCVCEDCVDSSVSYWFIICGVRPTHWRPRFKTWLCYTCFLSCVNFCSVYIWVGEFLQTTTKSSSTDSLQRFSLINVQE